MEQVINVLLDGQKSARQLLQLNAPVSEEQLSMIAQRIASSFSKSLSMLNYTDHSVEHISNVLNSAAESPLSAVCDVSPMSKKRWV